MAPARRITPALGLHGFKGGIGVSRCDITPPVGIYARNWGAARHERAEGVHRPLTATALSFAGEGSSPLVLLALDLGWWRNLQEGIAFTEFLRTAAGLDPGCLIVNLSHTHAGPVLSRELADRPGGDLISPYLEQLEQSCTGVVREAMAALEPGIVTWRRGRCGLAVNRDFRHPDGSGRFLTGYSPGSEADDTLIMGEVRASGGALKAVLVNYACHPTTIALDNRLLSPDFPGAMREVIEQAHPGALALFLQGSSGELSAAEQYSSEPTLADRHGHRLGYSVLEHLEAGGSAADELVFAQELPSGAPLAIWERRPVPVSSRTSVQVGHVAIPIKPDYPDLREIEDKLARVNDPVIAERLRRKRSIRISLGDESTTRIQLTAWRLGDAVFLAQPCEAYSHLQQELRRRFPGFSVVVSNLSNGSAGYLPPRELYSEEIYSVWQTPFAAGSLEIMIEHAAELLQKLQ